MRLSESTKEDVNRQHVEFDLTGLRGRAHTDFEAVDQTRMMVSDSLQSSEDGGIGRSLDLLDARNRFKATPPPVAAPPPSILASLTEQEEVSAKSSSFQWNTSCTKYQEAETLSEPIDFKWSRTVSKITATLRSVRPRTKGSVAVLPPDNAMPGNLLVVSLPNFGSQSLLVRIPRGWELGQKIFVPYEISPAGVLQHSHAVETQAVSIDAAHVALLEAKAHRSMCTTRCSIEVIAVVSICLLTSGLLPILLGIVGLAFAALLPTVVLMCYAYRLFPKSLFKRQMLITFGEAIVWMIPVLAFSMLLLAIPGYRHFCSGVQQDAGCYLMDAVKAFILAAFVEENLKYLAIRRIVFASLVVDAQGLFVYAGCGALGFAAVENVMYVFGGGGYAAAILRSVLSVPAHMCWGILIGCRLGFWRFLREDIGYVSIMAEPILLHGSFNCLFFIGARSGQTGLLVALFLATAVSIAGWLRVRALYLQLDAVVPEADVHALMDAGFVRPPTGCCCMCSWSQRDDYPERRIVNGRFCTWEDVRKQHDSEETARKEWNAASEAPSLPTSPVALGTLYEKE
eukprot:TRINITY_DN19954_c0_g1_i1.p1 TRINITY_DN19954_c0_g1~~TRINITY_DN19954_c0_g1_i1.p1  ORF type:complete len:569 (+),score=48.68 TRINITY_DN19954_c0_g1_i1:123-1829(+)